MKSEWWRGAIIYQIYPRSFFDANGDGIGDIAGINQKLDYICSLGVDALWISPFFKSPMRDFGYDVADYRAVDPIFGTNQDFVALISSAHRRGLKIIIDMVLAHTSDEHSWFQESRQSRTNAKADWGTFGSTRNPTAHLQTTGTRHLAAQLGSGIRVGGNTIFIITCAANRT